jgi:hypothetical protein
MRWFYLILAGLLIIYGMWPAATVCDATAESTIMGLGAAPIQDNDPCAMQCAAPSIEEAKRQGNIGLAVLRAFEGMIPAVSFVRASLSGPLQALFLYHMGMMSSGLIDGVDTVTNPQRNSTYWMANHLAKSVSDNTEFDLCRVKHLLGNYLDPVSGGNALSL